MLIDLVFILTSCALSLTCTIHEILIKKNREQTDRRANGTHFYSRRLCRGQKFETALLIIIILAKQTHVDQRLRRPTRNQEFVSSPRHKIVFCSLPKRDAKLDWSGAEYTGVAGWMDGWMDNLWFMRLSQRYFSQMEPLESWYEMVCAMETPLCLKDVHLQLETNPNGCFGWPWPNGLS